jgi:hypothetical protein
MSILSGFILIISIILILAITNEKYCCKRTINDRMDHAENQNLLNKVGLSKYDNPQYLHTRKSRLGYW